MYSNIEMVIALPCILFTIDLLVLWFNSECVVQWSQSYSLSHLLAIINHLSQLLSTKLVDWITRLDPHNINH